MPKPHQKLESQPLASSHQLVARRGRTEVGRTGKSSWTLASLRRQAGPRVLFDGKLTGNVIVNEDVNLQRSRRQCEKEKDGHRATRPGTYTLVEATPGKRGCAPSKSVSAALIGKIRSITNRWWVIRGGAVALTSRHCGRPLGAAWKSARA